jgi:hypothetical protein
MSIVILKNAHNQRVSLKNILQKPIKSNISIALRYKSRGPAFQLMTI